MSPAIHQIVTRQLHFIGLINPPLEDPNEPSYTLGHAPATVHHDEDAEAHVSVPEQAALANRLELARGAGHRYLTLHWGDGTVCDKTGRKRETEIQACHLFFFSHSYLLFSIMTPI